MNWIIVIGFAFAWLFLGAIAVYLAGKIDKQIGDYNAAPLTLLFLFGALSFALSISMWLADCQNPLRKLYDKGYGK